MNHLRVVSTLILALNTISTKRWWVGIHGTRYSLNSERSESYHQSAELLIEELCISIEVEKEKAQ